MSYITEKIATLTNGTVEANSNLAKAIEVGMIKQINCLEPTSVREIDKTLIAPIFPDRDFSVDENVRVFIINGNLLVLRSYERTINPYEKYMEFWEDFLDEKGISSYNLPFSNFYFYYKRYEQWLLDEELTSDETDFESYMEEIEQIDCLNDNVSIPETATVPVNDVHTEIDYEILATKNLDNEKQKIEDEEDALNLFLQTVDQKRAMINEKRELLNNLLS